MPAVKGGHANNPIPPESCTASNFRQSRLRILRAFPRMPTGLKSHFKQRDKRVHLQVKPFPATILDELFMVM